MHSFPQFNRSIVVIFVGKFSGGQFLSGPTFWGEILRKAIIRGQSSREKLSGGELSGEQFSSGEIVLEPI